MSDNTYSRKADQLVASGNLVAAEVAATLAVAKALREIGDDRLKFAARLIAEAIKGDDNEQWIVWEAPRGRRAIHVRHVVRFEQIDDGTTQVKTSDSEFVNVYLPFGTVAMMVGA